MTELIPITNLQKTTLNVPAASATTAVPSALVSQPIDLKVPLSTETASLIPQVTGTVVSNAANAEPVAGNVFGSKLNIAEKTIKNITQKISQEEFIKKAKENLASAQEIINDSIMKTDYMEEFSNGNAYQRCFRGVDEYGKETLVEIIDENGVDSYYIDSPDNSIQKCIFIPRNGSLEIFADRLDTADKDANPIFQTNINRFIIH